MRHGSTTAPVFARGSNVLDYWLAHAEGFRLERRGLRRRWVEAVVFEPAAGRARALIVRRGMIRRRRLVPVEAIAGVDPSAEVLLLDRNLSARLTRVRPAAEGMLTASATAGRGIGRGSVLLASAAVAGSGAAAAWSRPRLAAAALASARSTRTAAGRLRRGAAWLRPWIAAYAQTAAIAAVAWARAVREAARPVAADLRRALADTAQRRR
jgi:hypothetical protein